MAKWSGRIAYKTEEPVEIEPGIYEYSSVEYKAKGTIDPVRVVNQNDSKSPNTNMVLNNRIVIVANAFSLKNIHNMLYATIQGVKWRISSATVVGNKIQLNLSEVYHDRSGQTED